MGGGMGTGMGGAGAAEDDPGPAVR
jgi:hypothetical protein